MSQVRQFIAAHDDVSATPVVDCFQAAQHYRTDFDELRKQELRRLKKEQSKEIYDHDCKGMLWTLRHNHASLDDDKRPRLRHLFDHSPAIRVLQ